MCDPRGVRLILQAIEGVPCVSQTAKGLDKLCPRYLRIDGGRDTCWRGFGASAGRERVR